MYTFTKLHDRRIRVGVAVGVGDGPMEFKLYQTLCLIQRVRLTVSGVIKKLLFSLSSYTQRIRGCAIMYKFTIDIRSSVNKRYRPEDAETICFTPTTV